MIGPTIPKDEDERLNTLESYKILDTLEQDDFDFITKMLASICGTKIALISLVDKDRQWFLSHHGLDARQTPRELAFCAHAINEPEKILSVEDARKDERFYDNPLVTGDPHVIFYAGVPLVSEDGQAIGTLCAIDDQPKKLNQEQKDNLKSLGRQVMNLLELRRERYKTVEKSRQFENYFENNLDLLLIADNRGTCININKQWNILLDYNDEDLVGKKVFDFLHPDDRETTRLAVSKLNKLQKIRNLNVRFRNKEGEYRTLEWQANPDNNLIYISAKDITESIKEKQLIQTLTERNNAIMSSLNKNTLVSFTDVEGTIIYANSIFCETSGYNEEELIGQSHKLINSGYHPKDFWVKMWKTIASGEVWREEVCNRKKDGSLYWVDTVIHPIKNRSGRIYQYIAIRYLITERKQAVRQLSLSEETFRGSFEYAGIGMALVGLKGEWLRVNEKVLDIVGYEREELLKITFQDITHPDDLEIDLKHLEGLVEGKIDHYQIEKRYFHKTGRLVYVILSVSMVRDMDGNLSHFVSQIVDISAAKRAEMALHELASKNQAILDASTEVAIIGTDAFGRIHTFNKGAENLLGYTADDVSGETSPNFIRNKEEILSNNSFFEESLQSDLSMFEILKTIAEEGTNEAQELTFQHKNGEDFQVYANITPIINDDEFKGLLLVAANLSQIKKTEEELKLVLNLTKRQNERLKNFAYIVSHNLRSHSGNLSTLLKILIKEFPSIEHHKVTDLISKSSINLEETIAHLSEVAMLNANELKQLDPIDLGHALDNAISTVQFKANEENIKIINEVPKNLTIFGVAAYLDSILLNFLTNAIKYSSKERDSYIKIYTSYKRNFLVLHIEDNGVGIDMKRHGSKLFGMYKTFHEHEDARGIGLFITKNQIEAIGGHVEVSSELNKGTTFHIYLKYEEN